MLRSILFACVLLTGALAGCTTGLDLPAVDPPDHWRRLSQDDYETSSRCVGRPVTPMCAVETLLACFQRGQPALCWQVDDDTGQYEQVFATPTDLGKDLAYRVLDARRLTTTMLPTDAQSGLQPGDVIITVAQSENALDQPSPESTTAAYFVARQQPDHTWKIIFWGEPGVD
jgi:hypothetical protein